MGRPFSSALDMKQLAASPANPSGTNRLVYFKSGGLYTLDSSGNEYLVARSDGVTANQFFDLTADYTISNPAHSGAGLAMFTRKRGRSMLAMVDPQGLDAVLQPSIAFNRIDRWVAVNNSATPYIEGMAVTNTQAPTAVQNAATSFYTSIVRSRFTSTAAAGVGCGFRSTNPQWLMSSTANMGGFHFVCRWGINTGSATNREFIGLSTTTTQPVPNINPSNYLSSMGFGMDLGNTTLRWFNNDATGSATPVDLGASFPSSGTVATNFYEASIYAPSAGGSQVYWACRRLNDGSYASGSAFTDLPALDTPMYAVVMHSTGSLATAVAMDVQSLYIESDN